MVNRRTRQVEVNTACDLNAFGKCLSTVKYVAWLFARRLIIGESGAYSDPLFLDAIMRTQFPEAACFMILLSLRKKKNKLESKEGKRVHRLFLYIDLTANNNND